MASRGRKVVALGLILIAAGAGAYLLWPRGEAASIVGLARGTQIRIAPEVGGQLATIKVHKGDSVRAGDVVAELSATTSPARTLSPLWTLIVASWPPTSGAMRIWVPRARPTMDAASPRGHSR